MPQVSCVCVNTGCPSKNVNVQVPARCCQRLLRLLEPRLVTDDLVDLLHLAPQDSSLLTNQASSSEFDTSPRDSPSPCALAFR